MSSGSSAKMPGKKKKYNARFPPARIKKIMQKDEEVGKVAAPVPVIISRALELFVESLLSRAGAITEARHARTLTPAHLKQCILAERRFDFLQDLVSTVADINPDGESGEMLPGIFGSVLTSPVSSAPAAGTPPHTPVTPGIPMSTGANIFTGEGTPNKSRGRGAGGVRGGRGRGRGVRGRSGSEGTPDNPRPRGRPKKVPAQIRMVMDDMDSDEGLSVDIDSEEEEDEESETDEEVIEAAENRSITNHLVQSTRKEIPPLAPLPHTIPPVPDLKPINTSPIISHTKSFKGTPKIPGLQISIGGNFSNLSSVIESSVGNDSPCKNSFSYSPTSSTPSVLSSTLSSPLSSGIQISFLSPIDNKVSNSSNNSTPKNTITITPTSLGKSPFSSSSPALGSTNIPMRSPLSSPSATHTVLHSPVIKSPSISLPVPPQSPVSASAKPSFGVPVPVITSVHAMRFPAPKPQRHISQTEVDEDYDT